MSSSYVRAECGSPTGEPQHWAIELAITSTVIAFTAWHYWSLLLVVLAALGILGK